MFTLGREFDPGKRDFSQAVSYEEIFPRNFGVEGVKNFLEKKRLRGNFYEKSLKIFPGKKNSNTPSRGNFRAQNFVETRGNFMRKFYEEIFESLDNRTEISTR